MDAGAISKRLASQEQELTFEQFVQAIANGQTYSPSIYIAPQRKTRYFKQTSVFCADIDDNNYSYEEIYAKSNFNGYKPSIIHESFSSKKGARKWRVIYISDIPWICPYSVKCILGDIRRRLDGDPAIVDTARLLYSTTPDKIHYTELNLNEFQVSEEQVQRKVDSQIELVKLPETVGKRSQAQQNKHRIKAEKFFYDSNQPRRQKIFHTVRVLCFSKCFTEQQIRDLLRAFIEDNETEYECYDKDIESIVDEAFEWYESITEG